uniref:Uncharacterized protein n=1 Tax=Alexandrium monilatum TaxID=311494 RepID=A0A7S4SWV9_9DINO
MAAYVPRSRTHSKPRPSTPQSVKLQGLNAEVGRMNFVYDEVNKRREAHQKQLLEMLEETVRSIKQAHSHMQQKAKHVREISKSYTSKFEHDLSVAREALHRDLDEATGKMEDTIDALSKRMAAAEDALARQREARLAHTEATLGPIRDEAARLAEELKVEQKARQLREREQEKMVMDEAEAFLRLLDQEKFAREQQLVELTRWAEPQQQHTSKQQSHLEKDTRNLVQSIRVSHRALTRERIENQHKIIECISGFVHKFRVHLDGDSGFKELETALAAAPAA